MLQRRIRGILGVLLLCACTVLVFTARRDGDAALEAFAGGGKDYGTTLTGLCEKILGE